MIPRRLFNQEVCPFCFKAATDEWTIDLLTRLRESQKRSRAYSLDAKAAAPATHNPLATTAIRFRQGTRQDSDYLNPSQSPDSRSNGAHSFAPGLVGTYQDSEGGDGRHGSSPLIEWDDASHCCDH
jgi:hypothetical protein